jgi:dihydrodipicolinate synthase/N-acetylneuraminate lyase
MDQKQTHYSGDAGIFTRRQCLKGSMMLASTALAGSMKSPAFGWATNADPKIKGPFLILSTPFTSSGEVDWDDLAREASFAEWCGCSGVIWAQSGGDMQFLTKQERMRGMEVLANACRGKRTVLCLGVQGNDTDEMLEFAHHAESLAPGAIISRPPDSGTSQEDMREYYHALAKVAKRPVIIQTTGGPTYKGPAPSTELLVELARDFSYFGYVKEEHDPIADRIQSLVKQKPPIRRVFGAMGGLNWLYELRLGVEGLITERMVYADALMELWNSYQRGDKARARDIFEKFISITSLSRDIPPVLRGFQLYLLKKRGVIKTMVSRYRKPGEARVSHQELVLSPVQIEEIEFRFEALKPYMRPERFPG